MMYIHGKFDGCIKAENGKTGCKWQKISVFAEKTRLKFLGELLVLIMW